MEQLTVPSGAAADMRMPVPLRAGPVTLQFGDGDLRYLRVGGREIVRRIYVAVRDEEWGTIPYTLEDVHIDDQGDHFQIDFVACHRQGHIAFDWEGKILGTAGGAISFTFDGTAQSTFLRNRIGFCVLHPAAWAGSACEIEDPQGALLQGHFPTTISPHQPFVNIRTIRRHFADGITTEVRMEGDVFEMEDQRNWSDASFKTYSTPLTEPYPVEVTPGTRLHQEIHVQVTGAPFAATEGGLPSSVTLGSATDLRLPSLGVCLVDDADPLPDAAVTALRRLNLSHVRVDLDPSRDDLTAKLGRAWRDAQAIEAKLEIALLLADEPNDELTAVTAAVQQVAPAVARWLILGRGASTTPPGLATLARDVLAPLTPNAEIGGGTNHYFTELNRFRPKVDELDCVAYALTPQVHAFDSLSIIENLEAQPMTVASARQFAEGRPIVISPITLRPRLNAGTTEPESAAGAVPRDVDPRQPSQFAAAWTLGSLSHLALANVHALTYYETIGLRGILDGDGHPYPLYQIFMALSAFAHGTVMAVEFNDLLHVAALGVRQGDHTRLLVVNLTQADQPVRVAGLTGAWHITYLDNPNATSDLTKDDSVADLYLLPYGIAQFDQTAAA